MARPAGLVRKKVCRPARKEEIRLPVEVGLPLIAALIGIGLTQARELADRKVFVKGTPPSNYILEASVANYCRSLRDLATGRGGEGAIAGATIARGKLAEAQAEVAEAKAKRMRGEVVSAAEVETLWQSKMRTFRTRILSVGDRIGHLPLHDRNAITSELKSALTELSNG
ncbi:MAG: hypothetical protein JJE37_14105 [Methyloceanibacter sp.]|jgi:phage terminase Nu1 subunit (DNA packaging protein)|nr:hypothetical protein [Methyloceanibacter sp.]